MVEKTCISCQSNFPATNEFFWKKLGKLVTKCKECSKQEGNASYYKHREKRLQAKSEYSEKNKEVIQSRNQYQYTKNKEKRLLYQHEYHQNNKEKIKNYRREYMRNKCKTDIQTKMKINLSNRMRKFFNKKGNRTIDFIGCSIDQLKIHLESKFKEGMNWENYGLYGWHVDHIRPCTSFDLSKKEEQEKCFHYTNLQPLWAEENIKKSNHWNTNVEAEKLPNP